MAGESRYPKPLNAAMRGVKPGRDGWSKLLTEFVLIAEPTNEYDPEAIQVLLRGETVGYIPRDETREYHDAWGADLNSGLTFPGRIIGKQGRWGVTLRIDNLG